LNYKNITSSYEEDSLREIGNAILVLLSQRRELSIWSMIDILKRSREVYGVTQNRKKAIELAVETLSFHT